MKPFVVSTALALLAATGASRADANPLVNGSFEQPGPSVVAGSYCCVGHAPLEWGSLPGGSGVLPVIASSSGPWGNLSSLMGWDSAQGAVLVGLQNASFAVQHVGLSAGNFTLSWSDAGRANHDSTAYTVSFAGQLLGSFGTTAGQGWAAHTQAITVTGAGDLRFQGQAISADGTAFIDDVQLTAGAGDRDCLGVRGPALSSGGAKVA